MWHNHIQLYFVRYDGKQFRKHKLPTKQHWLSLSLANVERDTNFMQYSKIQTEFLFFHDGGLLQFYIWRVTKKVDVNLDGLLWEVLIFSDCKLRLAFRASINVILSTYICVWMSATVTEKSRFNWQSKSSEHSMPRQCSCGRTIASPFGHK